MHLLLDNDIINFKLININLRNFKAYINNYNVNIIINSKLRD